MIDWVPGVNAFETSSSFTTSVKVSTLSVPDIPATALTRSVLEGSKETAGGDRVTHSTKSAQPSNRRIAKRRESTNRHLKSDTWFSLSK